MKIEFAQNIPEHLLKDVELISGEQSLHFTESEFLMVTNAESRRIFEIKFEYHYCPFKEAEILDNILGVGHEQYFYLYDLSNKRNILSYKVQGMFGHLYVHENHFYVAYFDGIICFDKKGNLIWENHEGLADDGIIIQKFTDDTIFATGCFDPGETTKWEDFSLDKKTGKLLFHSLHK